MRELIRNVREKVCNNFGYFCEDQKAPEQPKQPPVEIEAQKEIPKNWISPRFDSPIRVQILKSPFTSVFGEVYPRTLQIELEKYGKKITHADAVGFPNNPSFEFEEMDVRLLDTFYLKFCEEEDATCWHSAIVYRVGNDHYIDRLSFQIGNTEDGNQIYMAGFGATKLFESPDRFTLKKVEELRDTKDGRPHHCFTLENMRTGETKSTCLPCDSGPPIDSPVVRGATFKPITP